MFTDVRGRRSAVVWALLLGACVVFLTMRFSEGRVFDTSILALLPDSQHDPVAELATTTLQDRFAGQALFLVGSPKGSKTDPGPIADEFAGRLRASGAFSRVTTRLDPEVQSRLADLYRPYRYQLLSADIRRQLSAGEPKPLVDEALRQLVGPGASLRAASVPDDPLNLLGHWLRNLEPRGGIRATGNGLTAESEDYRYRVVMAAFDGSPFDMDRQQAVLAAIAKASAVLDSAGGEVVLLRSGVVFHAAAGAEQAKAEISTIGAGSLLAIALLLLWYFRGVTLLLLPLASIGTGVLLALAVSLAFFGRIHIVTLAFGAGLVGVSIDYSLHYLCYRRQFGGNALTEILPGITLGLMSSVLAYAAQALTPFPGLQQMALFSATGLIGAWVTVVLWFPLVGMRRAPVPQSTALGRGLRRLAAARRLLMAVLGVLVVLAAIGLPQLSFHDDLRALNSSPPELLAQEEKVRAISSASGGTQFLLVQAEETQQVLEAEEAVRRELDELIADGRLESYQAMSQFIPSVRRQKQNLELVQEQIATGETLPAFFALLGASSTTAESSQARIQAQPRGWLTPDAAEAAPVHELAPHLWLGQVDDNTVASVISLGAMRAGSVPGQLAGIAAGQSGVRYIDRAADISGLLTGYRETVTQWLLLAYGIVVLLLACRYRGSTWRVVGPALAATLMTFGLLALSGQVLNLFNLLAALLILGVGLDMGIFSRESRHRSHAWEAITLSGITSALAFGLLALSDTPVLHHFGITVLPGIVLTWFLAFVAGAESLATENTTTEVLIRGSREA